MVITKHDGHHNDQPGIKEITYVAMIPGLQPKPASRRICELPSLRYGSVGAKSIITGPLTVTRYCNDTIPRMSSKKNKAFTIASDDMNLGNLVRPKRRVRFSLPPPEHATLANNIEFSNYTSNGGVTYATLNGGVAQSAPRGFLSAASNGHNHSNSVAASAGCSSKINRVTVQFPSLLTLKASFINNAISLHSGSSVNRETTIAVQLFSTDHHQQPNNAGGSAAALVYANGHITNPVTSTRGGGRNGNLSSSVSSYQYQQQPATYNNGSNGGSLRQLVLKEHVQFESSGVGGGGSSSTEYCVGSSKGKSASATSRAGTHRREPTATTTGAVIVNRASSQSVPVLVTCTPGPHKRIHPTGKYIRGTLSPTVGASAPPTMAGSTGFTSGGLLLLRASRDGEDGLLRDVLRRASLVGIAEADLNASDNTGRTVFSYIASNGTIDILEQILLLPGLDVNRPDNEGNTPLHFAAQAGQVECLNCMLTRCRGIDVDARNNLGFTALMKAALQGRNKCAKLLLFAGANPTLRDNGRGLRADQWARFCGRYVCADVIEKHARHRLLERSTSYNHWGGAENGIDTGARLIMGCKIMPILLPKENLNNPPNSNGIKSKLRKVFRTSSGPNHNTDNLSSARLVTQLTTAALCASSPVLPSAPSGVPAVVKSLIRPLTVPKLQITLAGGTERDTNGKERSDLDEAAPIESCNNNNEAIVVKNGRQKKKK